MAVVSRALELRRQKAVPVREVAAPRSDEAVTAAAASIPLDGTGWKTFKLGDAKWQRDAWHQYDINGDMRMIANWIGKACSRARLYLAEVDETGRPSKEVTDPRLQVIAETLFGSPAARAEAQRLMGIHLFVPGESFIVAESADNAKEDRWYVVSTSDIRRQGEKVIEVRRPQNFGGGWYQLKPGVDLLIRCWTPHPDQYDLADSSVRPGLIPLRQIEQYTKMEFAEVDSRLAGAGILFVPEEMEFPRPANTKANASGLSEQLTKTMSTALVNREDASSLVPIVVQVPGELIGQIQHITFFGELQQHLADRMDQAVNRLARTLEIEPEILTGKADMNHWSAWQVDESTINIHVVPLLERMCDALTTDYVRTALKILGEDPDRYVLWRDVSMLTVEPDRQKDGMEMWDKGLISNAAARKAGSWAEGDEPDEAEQEKRFALDLVKLDPSKIEWPDVRKAIGGNVANWEPPEQPAEGADQPNGAAGPANADQPGGGAPNPDNVRKLPTGAERGQPPNAAESRQAAALRVGAHMAVQRALELAGKRLLTRQNRDRYHDVPAHELHTVIRVADPARVDTLLAAADGPVVDLSMLSVEAEVPEGDLARLLSAYCLELVTRGVRHHADLLTPYLAAGLHAECGEVCYAPAHPGRCSEAARMEFHLPGRHDQSTHGNRVGKPRKNLPGVGPFTPREKAIRRGKRLSTPFLDPDKDAPAPDRQGKRAFREWELEAANLSKEAEAVLGDADRKERERLEEIERATDRRRIERARRITDGVERERELQLTWSALEKEMREGARNKMNTEVVKAMNRFIQKNPDRAPTWDEQAKIIQTVNARHDRRIEEARRRHFEGNPAVLTDVMVPIPDEDPRLGGMKAAISSYWMRVTDDTGFDFGSGIPVRDLKVQGSTFKKGWAFKSKDVVYVVEGAKRHEVPGLNADEVDELVASQIAKDLEAMGDKVLPEGWRETGGTRSIGWSAQESGNALASANLGGGTIVFWNRHGRGIYKYHQSTPQTADEDTLKHEWGHNSDKFESTGPEWGAARELDADPGSRVQAFQQRATQLHPINFQTQSDKPVPNGVTQYGTTTALEDYAESTELYLSGPIGTGVLPRYAQYGVQQIYFRDLFPERAKLLDAKHKAFAKEQKAKIRAERAGQRVQ